MTRGFLGAFGSKFPTGLNALLWRRIDSRICLNRPCADEEKFLRRLTSSDAESFLLLRPKVNGRLMVPRERKLSHMIAGNWRSIW